MLYIKYDSRTYGTGMVKEWHVGDPYPTEVYAENVYQVDADGDELRYVLSRFTNLPDTNVVTTIHRNIGGGHVKWYGDIAKFIVGNLT